MVRSAHHKADVWGRRALQALESMHGEVASMGSIGEEARNRRPAPTHGQRHVEARATLRCVQAKES